ncbi:uncharacterized protein VP01_524g6 [Puccinia sorghi]|uniref:Uncharacterized protein n=1 Tax=Puccinia sorghi TaxID=27349 RepID=A0A0L6UMG6_9BASI|nr:uncharacterized protein VP01_524g6 [Puccinia sorghi]
MLSHSPEGSNAGSQSQEAQPDQTAQMHSGKQASPLVECVEAGRRHFSYAACHDTYDVADGNLSCFSRSSPSSEVSTAATHAPAPSPNPTVVYQPLSAEIDHLARVEPLKIKDQWFSRDWAPLLSFLQHISNFLQPHTSLFQLEARRVIWILQHFGFHLLEHCRMPFPVKNWYNFLVINNAH